MSDKKNDWCNALSALFKFARWMTTEIFSSDEPCAVATALIPFFPKVWKSRPETPGELRMFSQIGRAHV